MAEIGHATARHSTPRHAATDNIRTLVQNKPHIWYYLRCKWFRVSNYDLAGWEPVYGENSILIFTRSGSQVKPNISYFVLLNLEQIVNSTVEIRLTSGTVQAKQSVLS